MNIELSGNYKVVSSIYESLKVCRWCTLENVKVVGIPAGSYSKDELIDVLKIPNEKNVRIEGKLHISILHSSGRNSGAERTVFKKAAASSVEECLAEHMEFYCGWYKEPIAGVSVCFVPIREENKEISFGRVYVVV